MEIGGLAVLNVSFNKLFLLLHGEWEWVRIRDMKILHQPFGEVSGADPRLFDNLGRLGRLSVRRRSDGSLFLLSQSGRMVTLARSGLGFGPDRISVTEFPHSEFKLPDDGWYFKDATLVVPFVGRLHLKKSKAEPGSRLFQIRDFPGHMQISLNRLFKKTESELSERLAALTGAIYEQSPEALELPLLKLVNCGEGAFPAGDMALCGIILAGRCFAAGKKNHQDWFRRLCVEVRRFVHKTSTLAGNCILYALEGRMTEQQDAFLSAMMRDFEGANDMALRKLLDDQIIPGRGFLIGVQALLEMIHRRVY